jgi:hypothetical protein
MGETQTTRIEDRVWDSLVQALDHSIWNFRKQIGKRSYRVSVGNFVFEESAVPSHFSRYLAGEVGQAVSRNGWEEYEREKLDLVLAEQKLPRSALFDAGSHTRLGNLKGLEGILSGNYWVSGNQVRVQLVVTDIETGRKTTVAVSVRHMALAVPPLHYERTREVMLRLDAAQSRNVTIRPDSLQPRNVTIRPDSAHLPKFGLEVWNDRGKSSTYCPGDRMKIFFKASKPCYVKLYHVSAEGKLQLIYPYNEEQKKSCEADKVYTVPEGNDRLEIEEPFGPEVIKAIASTVPFKEIEEAGKILGTVEGQGITRGDWDILRGLSLKGEMAEDTCVYAVVK